METRAIDAYNISVNKIPLQIHIYSQQGHPVPFYYLSLLDITDETKRIIDHIRSEIITSLSFELSKKKSEHGESEIKEQFKQKLKETLRAQFTDLDEETTDLISNYVIVTSLGLSEIEFLLKDPDLEEIVVNGANMPVWVYHKTYGWLKTNISFSDDNKIRHFATMISRKSDKNISLLDPLLDAHLDSGDRVNATLAPITTKGNTLTIRKFATEPWTITTFLQNGTIDIDTAALLWQAIQYELSLLIVGGTGSGKTSFLNVLSNFFPPNQRIISIEDTRELRLPHTLHWVPMQARLPNPEGKGGVTMLDCMINTLRMRPDRILVGEVRREKELEILFEALHTGHSVYSTFHASNVKEAVARLTNPPINLPKQLLSSLGLLVVQHRNRRSGLRRTFQVAELTEEGDPVVIRQYDSSSDTMNKLTQATHTYAALNLYTGMNNQQVDQELNEKIEVLQWLVSQNITDITSIGLIMSDYYTETEILMEKVRGNLPYENGE